MAPSFYISRICIGSIFIFIFAAFLYAQESSLEERTREFLRQRIEASGHPPAIMVGEIQIYSNIVLPQFYLERTYRPAWSDNDGPLSIADSLIAGIRNSYRDGLHPEDYHLEAIENILSTIRDRQRRNQPLNHLRLVDLDLLLTDAFLVLGSHFLGGRVDPVTLDPDWHPSRREINLGTVLHDALANQRIQHSLKNLLPRHPDYFRLRESLAYYRTVKDDGGWPLIPEGPTMRKGDTGERIKALHKRLVLAGDYSEESLSDEHIFDDTFDGTLEQAVIRFQKRHGLGTDGLVGRETLAQLNTYVEQRLQQVLLNMERWRWLPQSLGDRYILVNIANFELDVIENGESVMNMRVIVGRHYRRTPVFTGRMTYLVFSPFWNIPPGITANDVLPQIRKDISYLATNNIRVFRGWGADAPEVDPATVDWSAITPRNNPYRFRQDPGPNNSLGLVKFMFPNRFNVYLHDTPARELFARVQRDFSSGCIRIENPVGLSEYLLADRPEWAREAITAAMRRTTERTVTLLRPIPVHILYWTAWATDDGTIHFRRDIYNRDQRLYDALVSANRRQLTTVIE